MQAGYNPFTFYGQDLQANLPIANTLLFVSKVFLSNNEVGVMHSVWIHAHIFMGILLHVHP